MDGLVYMYTAVSSEQMEHSRRYVAEQRRQRALKTGKGSELDGNNDKGALHLECALPNSTVRQRSTSNEGLIMGRSTSGDISSMSTSSGSLELSNMQLLQHPFETRHGRRYLHDVPYPLPVDLVELNRQNLRTFVATRVFGAPLCSPQAKKQRPQKVLEVGCGSAYWSALCHQYYRSQGHESVDFVGIDIAPAAPDLSKQGVKWKYVQHDLRRQPLPFPDQEFDVIMLKDLSLIDGVSWFEKTLKECIRMLRNRGTLEVWDGEHIVRSIGLSPPSVPEKQRLEQQAATNAGAFLIARGTPFNPAVNSYLLQANSWIEQALAHKNLPSAPCSGIADMLHEQSKSLSDFGSRRLAIPLAECRWERDKAKQRSRDNTKAQDDITSQRPLKKRAGDDTLTADQLALRHTALLSVVQFIENLEPILTEVSGKSSEEWSGWWGHMMADLIDGKGASNGECLEIVAWWAVKIADR